MSIERLLGLMPVACQAKNAERWRTIFLSVYSAEKKNPNSVFARSVEDDKNLDNRLELFLVLKCKDKAKYRFAMDLIRLTDLNHRIKFHHETGLEKNAEKLAQKLETQSVKHRDIVSAHSVAEAKAGVW